MMVGGAVMLFTIQLPEEAVAVNFTSSGEHKSYRVYDDGEIRCGT